MSNEVQASGALPTFIVDRQARNAQPGEVVRLGDYIDDIDFDIENLRRACHDLGFSDTDIEHLTIRVSDNPSAHAAATAEYRHPSSTIWVYPWRQHTYRSSDNTETLHVRVEDEERVSQDLGQQLFVMAYDKQYYESTEVAKIKTHGSVRNALGYLAMIGLTGDGAYAASVGLHAGSSPPTPVMLVAGLVAGMWLGGIGWLQKRRLQDAERIRAQIAYEVQRMSHYAFERMVHIEAKNHPSS